MWRPFSSYQWAVKSILIQACEEHLWSTRICVTVLSNLSICAAKCGLRVAQKLVLEEQEGEALFSEVSFK